MPRSWPVAANTAAIAVAGREGDRLHPRGDGAVRARPRERLEVGGGRVEHALDPVVGERTPRRSPSSRARSAKYSCDGFLSPPMFASRIGTLGLHRRALHHVAPCSGRTRCGSSCSDRPRRRSSRPRGRGTSGRRRGSSPLAGARGARGSGRPSASSHARIAGSSASIQRAECDRVGRVAADEARRAGDPVGEHVGVHRSGRRRAAGHREGQAPLGVRERHVHASPRPVRSRRPRRLRRARTSPSSILIGQTETGMTATPVSASAAAANGSRSTEVTSPSTPTISWRARIESGSFFLGQRMRAVRYVRRMAATSMDGKALAARVRGQVADDVRASVSVGLATVLVGDDPGLGGLHPAQARRRPWRPASVLIDRRLPVDIARGRRYSTLISELNADESIHAAPRADAAPGADRRGSDITDAVDPAKDVDGFHPLNAGRLYLGRPTARARDGRRSDGAPRRVPRSNSKARER